MNKLFPILIILFSACTTTPISTQTPAPTSKHIPPTETHILTITPSPTETSTPILTPTITPTPFLLNLAIYSIEGQIFLDWEEALAVEVLKENEENGTDYVSPSLIFTSNEIEANFPNAKVVPLLKDGEETLLYFCPKDCGDYCVSECTNYGNLLVEDYKISSSSDPEAALADERDSNLLGNFLAIRFTISSEEIAWSNRLSTLKGTYFLAVIRFDAHYANVLRYKLYVTEYGDPVK